MNPRQEHVAKELSAAVLRLDMVLHPWGFGFVADDIQGSHCGPFASGHYCRDSTRIGISCRETIDNIYYQHTFITRKAFCTELERFTIGHGALMHALGYADECRLIKSEDIPDAIVARDGGDRVEALIHDLSVLASRVLREPTEDFYLIVKRGGCSYSIAEPNSFNFPM